MRFPVSADPSRPATKPVVRRGALVAFIACLLLGASQHPSAWGGEGHGIICEIAWQRLAPETRTFVMRLLRREARPMFSASCTWADQARDTTHPKTATYHYADVPAGVAGFDMARDCADPTRRCAVWAIDHYARILADPKRSAAVRRNALKFVAHLVGDLHQPLHVGRPGDRGGNEITVTFFEDAGTRERPLTLHRVWDVEILRRAQLREPDTARRLNARISDAEAAEWGTLDIIAWANDAYRVADRFAYPAVPADGALDNGYYRPALGHAHVLMQQAGVRLAYLLNRVAAGSLELPALKP